MPHPITRRRFLHESAALSAAVTAAFPLAAEERKVSANDKLNVALIGVGGQGMFSLGNIAHENVVALYDVDSQREDVVAARKAHPQAKFFQDFRRADLSPVCQPSIRGGGSLRKLLGVQG